MSEEEVTYLVDVGGRVSGPHTVNALVALRQAQQLPDDARVIYSWEDWSKATLLRDSPKLLAKMQAIAPGTALPSIATGATGAVDASPPAYRVVLVPAGSCESELDVGLIEQAANRMKSEGYRLEHIYESTTSGCCVGKKTAAVLVFHWNR